METHNKTVWLTFNQFKHHAIVNESVSPTEAVEMWTKLLNEAKQKDNVAGTDEPRIPVFIGGVTCKLQDDQIEMQ